MKEMINVKINERNFYLNTKIRTKIAGILIIFTLIPSICILLLTFFYINRINNDFIGTYIEARNKTAEYNFNKYTERISENYLDILSNNDFFLELERIYETGDDVKALTEMLQGITDDYINDIDIIGPNGSYYRCMAKNNIDIDEGEFLYKSADTNNLGEMVSDENGNFYFVIRRKLVNMFNGNDDGVMIIYVPEDDVCKIFGEEDNESIVFLADKDGRVLSSWNKSNIGNNVMYGRVNTDEAVAISLNNEEYYMSRDKIEIDLFSFFEEIYIVNIMSLQYINQVKKMIMMSMGFIVLSMILVIPIVVFAVSQGAVYKITSLQKKMERFALGDSIKLDKKNNGDEISVLESSFMTMVERINVLSEEKNAEREKQRIAELNALQAQINPHFIYNTLDSISWLAQMNNNTDIAKIVQSLSKFFRISLHNGEKYNTVLQEIEHVKSYLTVMGFRYTEKFDVIYDIDKTLEQELVLKTILQPVVENAINHGIRPLEGRGRINIKVYSENEYILFEVCDNGVGFDVNNPPKSRNGGYGLKNVALRIELEYGENCGIDIKSSIGEGTNVVLKVRKIEKRL